MKQIYLLIFLSILAFNLCYSQSDSIPLPLFADLFSQEILESLATGEISASRASNKLATIGHYQMAISLVEGGPFEFGFDTIRQEDVEYFEQFEAQPAKEAIIRAAKTERILMINESHQNPKHRMFTKSLLRDMYANGYRYLALEALNQQKNIPPFFQDSLFYQRGYLLNSMAYGTYISEPQMSNLIRHALDLGYEIISYDSFGKGREKNSAGILFKVFEEDKEAKMIIHCGWYHILEKPDPRGRTWLGNELKSSTGINPLTIYQDILSERSYSEESPFYEMMNFDSTLIFRKETGDFYNGFADNDYFDILVYHPRTKYIHNRPHWLIYETNNQFVEVENVEGPFPCLIKAFKQSDQSNAIPIDILEKRFNEDPSYLALEKGAYRIEIVDKNRDIKIRNIIVE